MGFIKAIKRFRWGYLLISVILCLAGACFIVYPTQSMTVGSYTIGGASILVGIILVIKVLADRKRSFSFAICVISAVLTITCGVVALIIPDEVFKLYPMFIGLFIIIDGAFKLQTVINAKRYNLKMWWFLLIFAIIAIVGGFLIVRLRVETDIGSVAFSEIMGISLFASGLENFFSLFYLGKIVAKAMEELDKDESSKDVYEDATIADSYIRNDDKVITVEILPNKKSEIKPTEKDDLDYEDKTKKQSLGENNDKAEDKKADESNVSTIILPPKSTYENK